ncbi:hypothetical protein PYCCODRAFT_1466127 [Trametes coccinea BRFM310]|uniref:Uncharacterized protein n=1 Tax=Trametes coccinea (strain BRFM310) TaxID=1353009 RepID=A0A1Y2IU98_TRAC3|nr:hypothetical protein PYCCODRAFT_1466127 [Trametes coccinea BRFM310]
MGSVNGTGSSMQTSEFQTGAMPAMKNTGPSNDPLTQEQAKTTDLARRFKKRPRRHSPQSSQSSTSIPSTPSSGRNAAKQPELAKHTGRYDGRLMPTHDARSGQLDRVVSSDRMEVEGSFTLDTHESWKARHEDQSPHHAPYQGNEPAWNHPAFNGQRSRNAQDASSQLAHFELTGGDTSADNGRLGQLSRATYHPASRQLYTNELHTQAHALQDAFHAHGVPPLLMSPVRTIEMPRPLRPLTAHQYDWTPSTPRLAPRTVTRPPTPFVLSQPLPSRPIMAAQPLVLEEEEQQSTWQPDHYLRLTNRVSTSPAGSALRPSSLTMSYTFTPPPPGGFPSMSFWDRDSLVHDLPQLRVDAIDKPGCDAVLIQIWNINRPRQNEIAELRTALTNAIRSGTGADNFHLFAPEPQWAAPGVPATDPATWIGLNISPDARAHLIAIGVWSSTPITFFVYPCQRVIPRFLFMLNGFTGNHNNDVSKAIATAFKSNASRAHLELMFAGNALYAELSTDDAMKVFLKTVRISMQPLMSGNFVTAVYCNPPTEDTHRWRAWRQTLTTLDYSTPFCGTGTFRPPSPCLGCHGADHLTHLCPYPKVPGWNAPAAKDRGRGSDSRYPPSQPGPLLATMPPPTDLLSMAGEDGIGRQRGGHARGGGRGTAKRGGRQDRGRFLPYPSVYDNMQ